MENEKILVEVKDGDVFINGEFASQLCWDEDAVGFAVAEWLKHNNEEDITDESKIDWNKVEVDTPILVKNYENESWIRRYFAKYEDGLIYAWSIGRTSWTANTVAHMTKYYYAKLAEDEE